MELLPVTAFLSTLVPGCNRNGCTFFFNTAPASSAANDLPELTVTGTEDLLFFLSRTLEFARRDFL